jgi:hypothetical protein
MLPLFVLRCLKFCGSVLPGWSPMRKALGRPDAFVPPGASAELTRLRVSGLVAVRPEH